LFEEFGFTYIGPIDGHNAAEMIDVMNRAKKMKGPVLLHVYTVKGKGYFRAEDFPCEYHGVESFNIESGKPAVTKIWDTYSDVFGQTMCRIAKKNDRIVAVTAAMPVGTGLSRFARDFPGRFFDVGIAEGHAVTFAAGMAKNGFIPVVAVYSTFLQRAYDQILHDVCLQNLPVVFAIDRAGLAGADGETHQGVYDLSFLTHIPNMTVMAPKNKKEFIEMLKFAAELGAPAAVRYPRNSASRVLKEYAAKIEHGKCESIFHGEKLLLISLGCMMDVAYDVYTNLKNDGYEPGLVNARFAKPVDPEMIGMIADYEYCFILEDNAAAGGLGDAVLRMAAERGVNLKNIVCIAFPDQFIPQGSRAELFEKFGMDARGAYKKIITVLAGNGR